MIKRRVIHEILDNIIGIVVVFNDEGEITFINHVGIDELHFQPGEVCIHNILRLLFQNQTNIPNYIEINDGTLIHTSVYRKNNTCFPASIRIKRIQYDDESIMNVLSINDETDENMMEKELDKAKQNMELSMRTRNELVANITHELRTPVNGVKGHIKNMMMKEEDSQKHRKMEIIFKCCLNMENIINDLLDFSKLEAGKLQLHPQPFKLQECVEHAVETNMSVANEKGIELSCYISEDVPNDVIGDDLRIIQILNNLLSNAIKFTSIGSVRLEVHRTYGKKDLMELTFFVMDTGIGMSLEEQDRLFKSFSQVDGSITRKYGGTGLGLFVTKQLVELMDGTISVHSEKGQGSTFSVTIQLHCQNMIFSENEESHTNIELTKERMIQDYGKKDAFVYGSEENRKQQRSVTEKLMLAIELRNWERADYFSDLLKQLLEDMDESIKKVILRMQMSIRKENYERSMELLNDIMKTLRLQ